MPTPLAGPIQDEVLYEGVERMHSHSTKADTEEEGGVAEHNVRPCVSRTQCVLRSADVSCTIT